MLKKNWLLGVCLSAIVGCTLPSPVVENPPPQTADPRSSAPSPSSQDKEREAKIQIVTSKLKQLDQDKERLSQRLLGRQQKISDLERHVTQTEAELIDYNRKVQAFITANKNPVGCMGAVGVSLGETNQYSKDVKDLASAVTLVCGVAIVANDGFRNEVIRVADQLSQANDNANNFKSQIQATRLQLQSETTFLADEEKDLSSLISEIQNYQTQLEQSSVSPAN